MGIDGIGRGGGPKPPGAAGDVGRTDSATKAERPFSVDRADPSSTQEGAPVDKAGAVPPSAPLERLRRGEIDVERYLDLKVDEATKAIAGLPPTDLADVKRMLRGQLATDPGLIELVRAATGKAPQPPPEDS